MMKWGKFKAITISCLFSTVFIHSSMAITKNKNSIKIIINDWSSQIVLAKITGKIFKEQGYSVEYVGSKTNDQWFRLKTLKAHVQVEVWEGAMADKFTILLEKNQIVDAGNHDAVTREEWWYPTYVEELCPGLPDWKALNSCAELFATHETAPKGRYVGGPWEKHDRAKIRALNLDFTMIKVKNANELWQEQEKAWRVKQPIVLFNWTPNWVDSRYDGKFIEFPEYTPACETMPKWGESKNGYGIVVTLKMAG